MDEEIKKPTLDRPKFFREPYDFRNMENAGEFRGVGEKGKTAKEAPSSSLDAMPPSPHKMEQPRDHKG